MSVVDSVQDEAPLGWRTGRVVGGEPRAGCWTDQEFGAAHSTKVLPWHLSIKPVSRLKGLTVDHGPSMASVNQISVTIKRSYSGPWSFHGICQSNQCHKLKGLQWTMVLPWHLSIKPVSQIKVPE